MSCVSHSVEVVTWRIAHAHLELHIDDVNMRETEWTIYLWTTTRSAAAAAMFTCMASWRHKFCWMNYFQYRNVSFIVALGVVQAAVLTRVSGEADWRHSLFNHIEFCFIRAYGGCVGGAHERRSQQRIKSELGFDDFFWDIEIWTHSSIGRINVWTFDRRQY